ncbi:hypothetical protein SAMN05216203_2242 [Marinobacter daqiaonensis]|uniref:Uncharacterized protein n=1 Tax=Marinobacter daqiaonensis TaxID=650891 RepID=A0A1I6IH41_9GAMM|nr:hypothetical protein [Marinobacter daqiaonensis]SFR65640.1 hypothetical protein SAMN05216203_2242 [Marinobacter daqiaonensis]
MFEKDPVSIDGPLGNTFLFTRHFKHNNPFASQPIAFVHHRVYPKQSLEALVRYAGADPFNYRLYDIWQMVFQKPWACPRNTNQQFNDLVGKIHGDELFVYLTESDSDGNPYAGE